MAIEQKMPQSLNIFFQEVNPEQLDLKRDADTIIERTLRFGNRNELHWLFNYYGQQHITTWIKEMGAYRLPKRHLVFWCLLLEIVQPPERKAVWPH